jgi:hypothetical protein
MKSFSEDVFVFSGKAAMESSSTESDDSVSISSEERQPKSTRKTQGTKEVVGHVTRVRGGKHKCHIFSEIFFRL